jgi:hypothetical protein
MRLRLLSALIAAQIAIATASLDHLTCLYRDVLAALPVGRHEMVWLLFGCALQAGVNMLVQQQQQTITASYGQGPLTFTTQHNAESNLNGSSLHGQLQPSPFQAPFPGALQQQLQAQLAQGNSPAAATAGSGADVRMLSGTSAGSSPQSSSFALALDTQLSSSLCGVNSSGSTATPSSKSALPPAIALFNSIGGNASLQQQQQQQLMQLAAVRQQQQQLHMLSNGTCVRLQPAPAQQHVLVATHGLTSAVQPQQLLLLQPQVQQQALLPPAALAAAAGPAYASASSASGHKQQQVVDFNSVLQSPALSAGARRALEDQLHEAYNSGYAAGFSDGVEAGRQQKRWR